MVSRRSAVSKPLRRDESDDLPIAMTPDPDPPLLTRRSGKVRAARALTRRVARSQRRLFLAEGPQVVREALARPGCVQEVFALAGSQPDLRAEAAELPWLLVDEPALASLTETVHPQGVVAVCRFLDVPLADITRAEPRLVAVCAEVRDPGNAGAVVRCADAAGAAATVFAGRSVDPYNGKAVRATAGSMFHVGLAVEPDPADVVRHLRRAGLIVLAADSHGEVDLDDAAYDGLLARRTAWLFGNEARGLPRELTALADHVVRVPIHGRAESLNLATAAAVCMYASAREQRRR
jgi:RNA methyltransferase, TrmH family